MPRFKQLKPKYKAPSKHTVRKNLNLNVRNLFHSYEVESMEMIYRAIVNGYRKSGLDVYDDA